MAKHKVITFGQFLADEQKKHNSSSGKLSSLMRDLVLAAKMINKDIRKAGLADILGDHGSTNIQGESVQKLDMVANEEFKHTLAVGGACCAIISEEEEGIFQVDNQEGKLSEYIVAIDPLDGSSNIDVNVSIGTIFSIFKRKSPVGSEVTLEDCLIKGTEQLASGYFIYGSSTMLVYTTGQGVHGFTLDDSIGDFFLSHKDIKTPDLGNIFSINEGNLCSMPDSVKELVKQFKSNNNPTGKPLSARYIGSLVADFHRNMLKGGVYIYPGNSTNPNGKLRLLYECAPLAFLAEQSGGVASDGKQRIMDIKPSELHQRTPYFVGSKKLVEMNKQAF